MQIKLNHEIAISALAYLKLDYSFITKRISIFFIGLLAQKKFNLVKEVFQKIKVISIIFKTLGSNSFF